MQGIYTYVQRMRAVELTRRVETALKELSDKCEQLGQGDRFVIDALDEFAMTIGGETAVEVLSRELHPHVLSVCDFLARYRPGN